MDIIAENSRMQIRREVLGPYGTNLYIVICRETDDSVIIDAPATPKVIAESVEGSVPRYLLLTHNHMDHTGALARLKSMYRIPLAVHELDAAGLPVAPDMLLNDGDEVTFGNLSIRVMHLPGHTPGSLGFLIGKYLISGDTLFPGGPGATGSPESFRQVLTTITGKLYALPDATVVLPGHGESTMIGTSKSEYAVFAAGEHGTDLCGDVLWKTS